jgi:hypothetical protein
MLHGPSLRIPILSAYSLLHAGIVSSELRGTGYGEQLVFSLRVRLMFDKCSAYLRYITKVK